MLKSSFYSPNDFPDHLPKLKELYGDLFAEGKGFRSKLVKMLAKHLPLDDKKLETLSSVIEYIHNSSLLHDDLIDKSPLRRGKTAAWMKYSPEYAVLAGDYLLAKVIQLLSRDTNIELVAFTSQTILDLLEGEWLQDTIKKNPQIDFAKIDTIHELKTSSLKKWCLRAPFFALNNFDPELHGKLDELGKIMGLLFQRADDLLDYNIRNSENKAVLGDHNSGYMNSFAIFMTKDLSAEARATFLQKNTLEDIISFIGKENFAHAIESFDAFNAKLMDRYDQLLKEIKSLLPADQAGICSELEPISKLLYWR
jgi:octaprenyl-diphosphate synthase